MNQSQNEIQLLMLSKRMTGRYLKKYGFLREYCNLPFSMDAKGNKYTLKRCEIKNNCN